MCFIQINIKFLANTTYCYDCKIYILCYKLKYIFYLFSHILYIMSTSNTNLQSLMQEYNSTLNQYQLIYEDYINALNVSVNNGTTVNDFKASPQAQQYQVQLQKLNMQMLL